MLKKILVAVLAAQLTITPVIAQEKRVCTKGFIGFDDALLIAAATYAAGWILYNAVKAYNIVSKRVEAEKQAKQKLPEQPAPDCKL